jgi:type III restriction enzyme
MLALREYQERSLSALQAYFRATQTHGTTTAFVLQTGRPYQPVPALPGLPYVCLRVPTGGGKTLMAAHAVGMTARDLLHVDTCVCLWLVPSNAILDQTLKALRDREHPYRQALQSQFPGDATVLDLTEALYVQRGTLTGSTVVIVSTLAALRVEDTDGRKVYEEAGALQNHFTGIPPSLEKSLEPGPAGRPIYSLANVLRLHRPVVIMDEAHNARTPLSFDTLARLNPSAIVEFTATPETENDSARGRFASNVLHHVSAAELKAEQMIKLPVRLQTHPDWKETLGLAIGKQRELEKAASAEEEKTGEYLRPIVLIQAQARREGRETLTPEVIRKSLQDDFAIPVEQVAIATGETRGIEDINLLARDCPIRFVITIQALREGWDCPFAYILCSLSEVHTARAVEQVLGRVLRMPNARRRRDPGLNCAYAFVASPQLASVMTTLQDAMVERLGFERMEAEALVVPPQQTEIFDRGTLFAKASGKVSAPPDLSALPEALAKRIEYDGQTGTLTVVGGLSDHETTALQGCFKSAADKQAVVAIQQGRAIPAGTVNPAPIIVPLLGYRDGDALDLFEASTFLDHGWNLAACAADLSEAEFSLTVPHIAAGEIDVSEKGQIETRFVQEAQAQLALVGGEEGWTLPKLANWLDRNIEHKDVPLSQSSLFMHDALTGLIEKRGFSLESLARWKFRLADAVARKIEQYRSQEAGKSFQRYLFGDLKGNLEVSSELALAFDEDAYSPNWRYEGGHKFSKHAFRLPGELKSEGEEFECARFIDQMPQVETWVRNIDQREKSFWLQTSTDKFYPDFIARLTDGRILVVEYKGADRWSNDDSKEKRAVGELWAERSKGRCIFVMPKGMDFGAISAAIK